MADTNSTSTNTSALSSRGKTKLLWLGFGVTVAILIAFFSGCGKDLFSPSPGITPGCSPAPLADAGGDQYISKGTGALLPDIAQIGKLDAANGSDYEWTPSEGLDNPHSAKTYASPDKTTVYTQKVTNKCGVAVSSVTINVLKESELAAGPKDFSFISEDRNGNEQTYFTGYRPNILSKLRVKYVHMPKEGWPTVKGAVLPEELDLTPPNFIVHKQPQGSCWAEGGSSCGTANLWYFLKKDERVSAQRIIDCSGFGTASGGGQISIDDFLMPVKGLVYEKDYPYNGHDNKCNKEKSIFREQAKRTFEITSASGGTATWQDHKNAMVAFGAPEVCGAASALQSGGWVSNPGGGSTNHCYSRFGWLKGENHGQPAGDYAIEQNSWGTGWGGGTDLHPGQGAYRLAPDGIKMRSNVETEHKYMELNNPCVPAVDAGPDRTIVQIPNTPQFVRIGTPAVADHTYAWTPVDSLDKTSIAQPFASPTKTTKYQVDATRSCNGAKVTAHAFTTVHVWGKNARGLAVEILQ